MAIYSALRDNTETASRSDVEQARPCEPITDRHGRVFNYLRVAVTERCNLRCVYCMPEEGVQFADQRRLLDTDELLRVIRVTASAGVDKIRFTGGEPLVRRDIVELVAGAKQTPGVQTVHLTTNGILLERRARQLRDAGLDGINISLDSLRPQRFARMTRRTGVDKVLASLHRVVELGFPKVKVNVVAMRGFNDDELGDFAELTRELPITVRFIELMPFDAHQVWKTGRFLRSRHILESLEQRFPSLARAHGSATEEHVVRLPDSRGKVAVIPAYTRSLCAGCNRIRLTADGQIRNCLYAEHEYDVRALLRGGGSDDDLERLFREAMTAKLVDGWAAQRQSRREGEPSDGQPSKRRESMTQIGG